MPGSGCRALQSVAHALKAAGCRPDELAVCGGGAFSPHEPTRYRGLVDALLWGGDHYQLLAEGRVARAGNRC